MLSLSIRPGTLVFEKDSVSAVVSVKSVDRFVRIDLDGSRLTVDDLRQKLWEAHQSQLESSGVDGTRYPMASRA